ncbi:uncharacterized protein L201_000202 [Kwoniella dendrophila CBS 6074]|uniref:Ricin B lectin domain-containing protein n=1 Tax=Kwoniella dendrophila CBS 6074 TaxID=1295534 RepID=A0AAX4JKD4_9TREE
MFSSKSIFLFACLTKLVTSTPVPSLNPDVSLSADVQIDINDDSGYYIVSMGNGECLAPKDCSSPKEGSQVVTKECSKAPKWKVPIGEKGGEVVHIGSGLVLDVGTGKNNENVTLAKSSGNAASQSFIYGTDSRFTHQSACLDLGPNGPQSYDCFPQNTNQVYLLRQTPQPLTIDQSIPKGEEATCTKDGFDFLHPKGRNDICVSVVSESTARAEQGVALTYCSGKGFPGTNVHTSQELMEWSLPTKSQNGTVKLGSGESGLCLEVGETIYVDDAKNHQFQVDNSMAVRVVKCDNNSKGQSWSWDGQFLKTTLKGYDQCLNILDGSGYIKMDNFFDIRPLQIWDCSKPDSNSVSIIGNPFSAYKANANNSLNSTFSTFPIN